MATADDIRRLQAAQRQLMAERAARERQSADPLMMPEEGRAPPQETLSLPNPLPYSAPAGKPSMAERTARAETTPAASDNFGRSNAEADSRAASWEGVDPTNVLGLPDAAALNVDVPQPKPKTGLDAMPLPPAHSKAPVQAGRSPVRGWNLPAAESGTLPGEEQVTSMDVFKRLKPQEQAAIRQKYEAGSHADNESFEDYLGLKYGDMPPDIREMAMRAEYGSPSELSPAARAHRASGRYLPEGLKPGVYTDEQRTRMGRNVHRPEVPMTNFGGTFTVGDTGGISSRAPAPHRLEDAAKAAAYAGEGSFEHMRALGKAYGIDVSQYDPKDPADRALLKAHVMAEKQHHDLAAESWDAVQTPNGGWRYKFNPQKAAEARARRDLAMSPQRKAEFANTIAKRFAGMMTPEQLASLDTLVQTPDGFAQLRALNQRLTRQRDVEGMRSWRSKQQNYAMTQQMANPNYAPGMAVRSLVEAVRSGDPSMMAAAYAVAGNQPGMQRAMDLAIAQSMGASQLAQAQAYSSGRGGPAAANPTMADQLGTQMNSALSQDPALRRDAVRTVVAQNPANQNMTADQINAHTDNLIAAHEYRQNPNSPILQGHLQMLRQQGQAPFVDFAVRYLNLTRDQAEQMYRGGRVGLATALGEASPQAWGGAPPQGPRS